MNKLVLGITGIMGSGKSTLSKQLQLNWHEHFHHRQLQLINLDDIRRYILWESIEEEHQILRQKLAHYFKFAMTSEGSWLDRIEFTKHIFSSHQELDKYSLIATPFLKRFVNQQIDSFDGDSLIEWSYMIEEKYDELINSSILMTHCSDELIIQRLLQRCVEEKDPLPEPLMRQRIKISNTNQDKIKLASLRQLSFIHINNERNHDNELIGLVIQELIDRLPKE